MQQKRQKALLILFTLIHGDEFYREDVNKIDFIIRDYQDHLDAITAFPHLAHNTWEEKGNLHYLVIWVLQELIKNMPLKCCWII